MGYIFGLLLIFVLFSGMVFALDPFAFKNKIAQDTFDKKFKNINITSSYYVKLSGTEIGMAGTGYKAVLKSGGVLYLSSLTWHIFSDKFVVNLFMPNKCYEDLDDADCGQTLGKQIELSLYGKEIVNTEYGKIEVNLVQFGLDYTKDLKKCDKYDSVLQGVYSNYDGYVSQTSTDNICSALLSGNFKQGKSILYNKDTVYVVLKITELN